MKKVIAICVGAIVAVVASILVLAATKPDRFHIERSTTISATPDQIYPHINNYKNWAAWSPWEKVDPNMKRTYSGPESGKGAKYAWTGNDDVGAGDMEIVESDPSKIEINFHQSVPFEGNNKALFTMQPQGEATKVTWAMDGDSPFMCKLIQVFFSMDDMVGKEFDKGLASLKTIAETPAAEPAAAEPAEPAAEKTQ